MATSTTATDPSSTPPSPIEWLQCMELGYVTTNEGSTANAPVCFHCGKSDTLSKCAKCHVAAYCSRDCQVKDWKGAGGGHKFSCAAYSRVGTDMVITNPQHQELARQDVFARVRFYACPYAVFKSLTLGRGFLFVQSGCTLAELSLPTPKSSTGRAIAQRFILLHYLTLGEFDSEVCRDDFELAAVRTSLIKAVEDYDEQTSLVLLMRFRCGHVALGVAKLVPDYGLCKSLGKDYFANNNAGALQLNLDDL